jgi:predicted acylesterase/phospholipase RssA
MAIRNYGVPIDIVGGTSIGSLIGGIFAENPEGDVVDRARAWFMVCSGITYLQSGNIKFRK